MDNFFKEIKYYTIQLITTIVVGIAYILIYYPLWSLAFFQSMSISTWIINVIIGLPIGIIAAKIRDNNEDEYNKHINKKD